MCLQFLQLRLLESPSSLLASALPTLGSANSADSGNSKTTGITNKISNTVFSKRTMISISLVFFVFILTDVAVLHSFES